MRRLIAAALALLLVLAGCAGGTATPIAPEDGDAGAPEAPALPGGQSGAPTDKSGPEAGDGQTSPEKDDLDIPESPEAPGLPDDSDTASPPDDSDTPNPPEDEGAPGTENKPLPEDGGQKAGDVPDIPDTVNPADAPGTVDIPEKGGGEKPDIPSGRLPGARPSSAGKLAVNGRYLVSQDGRAVQLRGVSTHGLAWYPQYVNGQLFRELSEDWGCSAVRLALYTQEYGGWCSGGDREALLKLIYDGVRYASESDMYAIVDWHILSDGDPNTHRSEALDFFRTVSRELKDSGNVLYEICNEPNGGVTWASVRSYALEVIAAIRENDPDAVILVGTPNWCQYLDEAVKDPITEYGNIMYTLHFYAATHTDSLRKTMLDALDAGLPVFVSEFGICDASGNGRIDEAEADKWMEELDLNTVSAVMWSLSNKAESASIISSSCQKTSGFTQDDLSQAGRWLLKALNGEPSAPETQEPRKPETPTDPSGPEVLPGIPGPSFDEPSGGDGEVSWVLEAVNSWESGGRRYCQYALTVVNETDRELSTWSAEPDMGGEFALESFWNGVFEVSGNKINVTPADYNSVIPARGSVRDIGFIVSFG